MHAYCTFIFKFSSTKYVLLIVIKLMIYSTLVANPSQMWFQSVVISFVVTIQREDRGGGNHVVHIHFQVNIDPTMCRNGICKWFFTRRWFWRKFKLFFSHLFLFLGEINIFQLSSLTELQKDWHHLVLNLEKVQWKLIICCWWIIVESISKKN